MSYFLKQTRNKKGTYLQIYESTYDPGRGYGTHRSVRAVGYVHELEQSGIPDPVARLRAEVAAMNEEARASRAREGARLVGDSTPERHMGHFPVRALYRRLGIPADIGYLQMASGFRFSLDGLLESLVCARVVAPCSKSRTFHDVLPLLGEEPSFSLGQLYDGISYLGHEYRKVVEAANARVGELFGRDTSRAYFDCTNFYFETGREDGLRRKGPSKERRADPIVGMGLLLDARCVPMGLEIYPGNESERPRIREAVGAPEERHHMTGRTVRVADKGPDCADNVADAVLAGDGYLFSRSVRRLPARELAWVLSEEGWEDHLGRDGRIHHRTKSVTGDFEYRVSREGGGKGTVELRERRVVTFSPRLRSKQLREINRQVEKARRLRLAEARRSEYGDSAKYVTFVAVDSEGEVRDDERVVATLNRKAIGRARSLAGYNMLVTSEADMPEAEVYDTYHRLWRIEETFRVMKSELDARPVYLRRHDSIVGHFLICYVAVLLVRLLQVHVLGDEFGSGQLFGFMRGFRAVRVSERRYVNISRSSPVIDRLKEVTRLPLDHYHLTKGEYDRILGYRFPSLKATGQEESKGSI